MVPFSMADLPEVQEQENHDFSVGNIMLRFLKNSNLVLLYIFKKTQDTQIRCLSRKLLQGAVLAHLDRKKN